MQLKNKYLPPMLELTQYAAKKLNAMDDQGLIQPIIELELKGGRSEVRLAAHWTRYAELKKLLDLDNPAHDGMEHMALSEYCQSVADVDAAIIKLQGRVQIAADLLAGDAA